eukprot:6471858-Amphidinium_carterae.2
MLGRQRNIKSSSSAVNALRQRSLCLRRACFSRSISILLRMQSTAEFVLPGAFAKTADLVCDVVVGKVIVSPPLRSCSSHTQSKGCGFDKVYPRPEPFPFKSLAGRIVTNVSSRSIVGVWIVRMKSSLYALSASLALVVEESATLRFENKVHP